MHCCKVINLYLWDTGFLCTRSQRVFIFSMYAHQVVAKRSSVSTVCWLTSQFAIAMSENLLACSWYLNEPSGQYFHDLERLSVTMYTLTTTSQVITGAWLYPEQERLSNQPPEVFCTAVYHCSFIAHYLWCYKMHSHIIWPLGNLVESNMITANTNLQCNYWIAITN